jgi:hypothetical protein
LERIGDKNAHKVSVEIPTRTIALGRVRRRRYYNKEVKLQEMRV